MSRRIERRTLLCGSTGRMVMALKDKKIDPEAAVDARIAETDVRVSANGVIDD